MIPISRVSAAKLHQTPVGTIAMRKVGQKNSPRLIAKQFDEDGDADQFYVPLQGDPGIAFICQPLVVNEGLWIPTPQWDLRVDLDSAFSAFDAHPTPGDAIFSDGERGVTAAYRGEVVYISLAGATLPEPNWAGNFVGFKRWEIVFERTEGAGPEVLVERKPQP